MPSKDDDTNTEGNYKMTLVHKTSRTEIWEVTEAYGSDFYVYVNGKHVRTCPSLGMAKAYAA